MSPKNEEASAGCPPVASVGSCFFCGQVTSHRCGHCSNIFTCSKVAHLQHLAPAPAPAPAQEHHLIHRPGTYCYPFIVKVDPVVGRYVVAARDIDPCEPVLRELPAGEGSVINRTGNESPRSFHCPEKAPTIAFSLLKAPTAY